VLVKKGKYLVIEEKEDEDRLGEIPEISDNPPGVTKHHDIKGKQIKTKQSTDYGNVKTKINTKSINWSRALTRAMSRNPLSAKAKKLLSDLSSQKPLVDWRRMLKRFFDRSFTGTSYVFPKRRFIGQKKYLYGTKQTGVDTLKTVVVALDTSGSISHDQGQTMLIEVANLCNSFRVDRLLIIYCSDNIHEPIQDLKRGQKPDLTLWPTTGGNSRGFLPPFEWVQKNKINPSVFIYMTDTGGEMPRATDFGIDRYKKRVFWFIVGTMYVKPPFGEIIYMPYAGLK
jgi:predicted metal-dependent peptidase